MRLEGIEERKHEIPLLVRQRVVTIAHAGGLVAVALDRFLFRERQSVVHQPVARPQRPQRRRADQIPGCRVLGSGQYGNAVARGDVVRQEVAIRMKDLVPQRERYPESAAVDERPGPHCPQRCDVAAVAADLIEELFAGLDVARDRVRATGLWWSA